MDRFAIALKKKPPKVKKKPLKKRKRKINSNIEQLAGHNKEWAESLLKMALSLVNQEEESRKKKIVNE